MIPDDSDLPLNFDLAERLIGDLRNAARILSLDEQRYLVDLYYQVQKIRIGCANQIVSGGKDEPNLYMQLMAKYVMRFERMIIGGLDNATNQSPLGRWCKRQYGVGPVLTAGFMAHIDVKIGKTVSALWRFAGQDPTAVWLKGERRPWNARLKTLCFKLGDCFVKFHNRDECFYGHYYANCKQKEVLDNDEGRHVAQAIESLKKLWGKPRRVEDDGEEWDKEGDDTTQSDADATLWCKGCYPPGTTQAMLNIQGLPERNAYLKAIRLSPGAGVQMLPPLALERRARRKVHQLFLSHYYEVAWEVEYGTKSPKAYILAKDPTLHTQYIAPPHWPLD